MKKLLILLLLASCAKQKVTPTQQQAQIIQAPVQKQFNVSGKYMFLYTSKNRVTIKPPFFVVKGDSVYVQANGNNTYPPSNDLQLNITLDVITLKSISMVNTYSNTFIIQ